MGVEAKALDLPPEAAISFLRQKINVPTTHWRQVYAAAHAHSFMVAGAASDAIVADFRKEIEKALEQGTTLEEFRKGFDAIVEKHGWEYKGGRNWRTRIIFETNLRSAHAAGRYYELTKPETLQAFPFWQYNHSGSNHPRKQHLAWDGDTYRYNDPFWSTNYPPNGWHCGCFVTPVSDADLKRQGKNGPDKAPNFDQSGSDIPRGVDPGFEWNPGQRWLSGGRPEQKIATINQVEAFAIRALAGELPVNTTVPIASVPDDIIAELGLEKKSVVRLSVQTILDHSHRKNLTAVEYAAAAQTTIADLIRDDRGRLSTLYLVDGKWHIAGFKVTRFNELLMTTLHIGRPSKIKKMRRLKKVVE